LVFVYWLIPYIFVPQVQNTGPEEQVLTGKLPRRCSFYLASDLPCFGHLLRREYRFAESCDRDVFLYWPRHVHAALYSPSVVDERALVDGL
jgi:hypothetical protein